MADLGCRQRLLMALRDDGLRAGLGDGLRFWISTERAQGTPAETMRGALVSLFAEAITDFARTRPDPLQTTTQCAADIAFLALSRLGFGAPAGGADG